MIQTLLIKPQILPNLVFYVKFALFHRVSEHLGFLEHTLFGKSSVSTSHTDSECTAKPDEAPEPVRIYKSAEIIFLTFISMYCYNMSAQSEFLPS